MSGEREAPIVGAGLASFTRALFVHAHPDDETIVTGGTIATLVDLGSAVTVLTCTRGEKGEIVPADLQHLLAEQPGNGQGDAVAAHREGELSAAMAALGVSDHRWLGEANARLAGRPPRRYRDSGMVWGATGPEPVADLEPDALCSADLAEIAADIATVIVATDATAVVSYNVRGGYGHPDHVLTAAAARRAAAVLGIPFFSIEDNVPETAHPEQSGGVTVTAAGPDAAIVAATAGMFSVDIRPVLHRKVAALRAHRSQLTVEGESLVLSGGQVSLIGLDERFQLNSEGLNSEVSPAETATKPGNPLSWRQRAAASVFTVGAGVVVGAITTVAHQSELTVAAVSVPLGLIVGLTVITALLVGLRLVFRGRALAVLAAVGILGAIAILSQESAGGSVLVPAEPLALYWVYGPVVIAFFSLAWPNLAQARRDKIAISSSSNGILPP